MFFKVVLIEATIIDNNSSSDISEISQIKKSKIFLIFKTDLIEIGFNCWFSFPYISKYRINGEELFKNEDPVGKVLGEAPNTMKITGVVNDFKDKGDYRALPEGIFMRMDTSNYNFINALLINRFL